VRIAFVSAARKDSKGGAARVAQEMARCFAQQHDVVLIYPDDKTRVYKEGNRLTLCEIQSAGQADVAAPSLSHKNLRAMNELLTDFKPNIVHAHDPISLGLIGQIWAKENGVPFISTTHLLPSRFLDFGMTELAEFLKSRPMQGITGEILRNFYNNCDAVIAPNRAAAEDLRRLGHTGRIFVIPNGRDLAMYQGCRAADISAPEKVLTFVGWICERKNQLYLVQAQRYLPHSYKLQIIGEWLDGNYRSRIERIVRENELTNVQFIGRVEHNLVPAYLERAHVFVSASRMEVQSLSVIEALASGTPVVGLSNETIDELVDGTNGAMLPRTVSPEEFARRVRAICEQSQPDYEAMCRAARTRVSTFDWQIVMASTIETYEQVSRTVADDPIPKSTWFYMGLTILASLVTYFLMRPVLFYLRTRGSQAASR
jgi:1,2-diacylglycerol 3-alpha-glucosyltransferase